MKSLGICIFVEVPYNTKKVLYYNDIILTDDKVLQAGCLSLNATTVSQGHT